MSYLVSITSQGQISIPVKIRKELKLSEKKKALVKRVGRKVLIEPVEDLFSLAGAFRHKAIKNKSMREIIEIEERAWEKEAARRYLETLKR